MDPLSTIPSIRLSAKLFRNATDETSELYDKNLAKQDYIRVLNQRIQNSTRADIAKNEIMRTYPINFPICYDNHKKELEKLPEIDKLIKESDAKINSLYPKTAKLRQRLIEENLVVFDKVKPALKWLGKKLFKLKFLF